MHSRNPEKPRAVADTSAQFYRESGVAPAKSESLPELGEITTYLGRLGGDCGPHGSVADRPYYLHLPWGILAPRRPPSGAAVGRGRPPPNSVWLPVIYGGRLLLGADERGSDRLRDADDSLEYRQGR